MCFCGRIKIINGDHDWPSPLSFWANQYIIANIEVWNFVSKFDMMGIIDCNPTNDFNTEMESSKTIIRMVDLLGKETKQKKSNQLFLYLYDDGSVDKKIILE